MKASKEELEKRKQAHQSKNIDLIKYEKQQQQALKVNKNQSAKAQLALLKEILYDDEQLKNLINKSDSTLRTVQDFFSLDPDMNQSTKRQAKINMTLAPNVTDLNESNLPFNSSSLKKKSHASTVTTARVNNLNDDQSDETESESEILDLKLKQAKQENNAEKYKQLLQLKQELITKKLNDPNLLKPPTTQHEVNNQSLLNQVNDDLKKCLSDLEAKIIEFDKQSGKYTASRANGQATCTQTLIRMISCLFDYIKELKNDLNYEKLVTQETSKQMDIHRKLIDGLTNEILLVKEQNEKLLKENSNLEKNFNSELDQIKELIRSQLFLRDTQQNPPNIIDFKPSRPSAFKSHELIQQQQQQQQQRPMSCVSYQSFNSSSKDKFTERINAMLQHDLDLDKPKQKASTSSSNLDISSLVTNKQSTDFSQQLQELTSKNQQAHQKLKLIQSDFKEPRDLTLERLKQEQELIKEQINLLNKQRESAQIELDVLSLTSSSTNLNAKVNSKKQSPSISPISLNENIYSEVRD